MPNFFALIDEMAKRYIELLKSDYKMSRTVNGKRRNAYASGNLYNSLAYRLNIKGNSIEIRAFAKGSAKKYFEFREFGVNGTERSRNAPYSFKKGSGSKPAKGELSPMQKGILQWMNNKPIRLRNQKGGFVKSTEELKIQVAKMIMFKVRREGIEGWHGNDYAVENVMEEYGDKISEAYHKDITFTIEQKLLNI